MQLFDKPDKPAQDTPAQAKPPEEVLIDRICDDWKAVAKGDTTIKLASDLYKLSALDGTQNGGEALYGTHINTINQRLDSENYLPNLNIIGARNGQVLVQDKLRGQTGLVEPGRKMMQVHDLVDDQDINSPWIPKEQKPAAGLAEGPVTPDSVHQTVVPDCKWQAHLASFAKANPEAVKKLIHDNNDGTYTVTFPGDKEHPETIEAPTPWEKATFSTPEYKGNEWALLIDKAFRQRTGLPFGPHQAAEGYEGLLTGNKNAWIGAMRDDEPPKWVSAIDWMGTKLGLEPITKNNASADSLTKQLSENSHDIIHQSRENMPRLIKEALDNHMIITTAFLPEKMGGKQEFGADPGLHKLEVRQLHDYAITDYDPQKGTITLRNPWAFNYQAGTGDTDETKQRINSGYITMDINEYKRSMVLIDVEPTNPLPPKP